MERRLAAILAADVVGYSRRMGADEAGTMARRHSLRAEVICQRRRQNASACRSKNASGMNASRKP